MHYADNMLLGLEHVTKITLELLDLSKDQKWTQSSTERVFESIKDKCLPEIWGACPPEDVGEATRLEESLPETYETALLCIKDFVLVYEEVHFCISGCRTYGCNTPKERAVMFCEKCNEPRYKSTHAQRKKARCVLRYIPLRKSLPALFANPLKAGLLNSHEAYQPSPEEMADIYGE